MSVVCLLWFPCDLHFFSLCRLIWAQGEWGTCGCFPLPVILELSFLSCILEAWIPSSIAACASQMQPLIINVYFQAPCCSFASARLCCDFIFLHQLQSRGCWESEWCGACAQMPSPFFMCSTVECPHSSAASPLSHSRAVNQAAYLTHMGSSVIRPGSVDTVWSTGGARNPFRNQMKAAQLDVLFACAWLWLWSGGLTGFIGRGVSALCSLPRTHLFPILTGVLSSLLTVICATWGGGGAVMLSSVTAAGSHFNWPDDLLKGMKDISVSFCCCCHSLCLVVTRALYWCTQRSHMDSSPLKNEFNWRMDSDFLMCTVASVFGDSMISYQSWVGVVDDMHVTQLLNAPVHSN